MIKRGIYILGFLLWAANAEPATKYVHTLCTNGTATYNALANGGAGSCTGGNTTVYSTINNGIATLKPGDFLYIRAGTYSESLNWATGGTAAQPITIAKYPGETVILRPPSGSGMHVNGGSAANQYIIYDGLIVDGSAQPASNYVAGTGACCHYDAHLTFKNGEIRNWTGHAIEGFAEYLTFSNNLIHDNSRSTSSAGFGYAAYIACRAGCIWEDNQIYNHRFYGFHIWDTGQTNVSNNIVRRNKFFSNGTATSGSPGGFALLISSGSNNEVYNNLVYNNGVSGITGGGIQVAQNCNNCKVYNNTIYNNANWGLLIQNATSTRVTNNIIWNNSFENSGSATVQSFNLCVSGCTGAGTANGLNPQFVSSTDFKLQSSSPAINSGTNTLCPATDIANTTRPIGGTCDMGAYEFTGLASVPTVLITSPSATGTYSAISTPISTIAGSATSGVSLTSVTWSNDRGGSGTATGTTNWSIPSVALQSGVNVITVTVTDSNGQTAQATLTITLSGGQLIGAWGCDEGSGTTVADSSGNGNNGTFTTPGWTVSGKFGSACVFTGAFSVVTVADADSLDATGGLTLSGWVKPALQTDAWRAIFAKDGSYWMFASSSGQCGVSAVYAGFYTGTYQNSCYSTPLPLDTWTFAAMRFDGATQSIYTGTTPEDLTLRATRDVSAFIVSNTNPLRIGNDDNDEAFVGQLDNLRVHNYGRSDTVGSGTCGSSKTTGLVYSQLQCDMITPVNPNALIIIDLNVTSLQLGPGVSLDIGTVP